MAFVILYSNFLNHISLIQGVKKLRFDFLPNISIDISYFHLVLTYHHLQNYVCGFLHDLTRFDALIKILTAWQSFRKVYLLGNMKSMCMAILLGCNGGEGALSMHERRE